MTDKFERKAYLLIHGEDWRLMLECMKPGTTHLILERGGVREARIPIENVLQGHLKVDDGAVAEEQRQITGLRRKVGDLETQIVDQQVVKLERRQAQDELIVATGAKAVAEAELAHLRQTIKPSGDPELEAKYRTLTSAVRTLLARCPRCNGLARVGGIPCPYCGVFRELMHGIDPPATSSRTDFVGPSMGPRVGDERMARSSSDLERGQVALEGSRQEQLSGLDRMHVFMLHPGVGSPPYWELGNERDPTVQAFRRGELKTAEVMAPQPDDPLPIGYLPGLYLALATRLMSGESDWVEVTAYVTVDRERGLAAVPERLRSLYASLPEGRW